MPLHRKTRRGYTAPRLRKREQLRKVTEGNGVVVTDARPV